MIFKETRFNGVYLIYLEKINDDRGFFARTYCEKEFVAQKICFPIRQSSISFNKRKGTLRGMHYQIFPHEEAKIISCLHGSIYDVVVDLRIDSPTYGQWIAFAMNAQDFPMIYVPKGCAHGFQTLEDDTVVLYWMSEFYHPESACGFRWNDPLFDIQWPKIKKRIISAKDQQYADFML